MISTRRPSRSTGTVRSRVGPPRGSSSVSKARRPWVAFSLASGERGSVITGGPERKREALGIQELIVAIGETGTEQLANGAIHLGAARAALVCLAHDLGHGGERGVDLLEQAPAQEGVGEHAHHSEDGQEHPRVPEGEPGPDGQRSHGSSFST